MWFYIFETDNQDLYWKIRYDNDGKVYARIKEFTGCSAPEYIDPDCYGVLSIEPK